MFILFLLVTTTTKTYDPQCQSIINNINTILRLSFLLYTFVHTSILFFL